MASAFLLIQKFFSVTFARLVTAAEEDPILSLIFVILSCANREHCFFFWTQPLRNADHASLHAAMDMIGSAPHDAQDTVPAGPNGEEHIVHTTTEALVEYPRFIKACATSLPAPLILWGPGNVQDSGT